MNLKEQQYIVALADHGSITRAAAALGITQPALSAHLTNVEASLGLPLFQRVGKRLTPTYAGLLYLEKARQMLEYKSEFDTQLSDLLAGSRSQLRIGIQLRRAFWIIPFLFRLFREEYPQIELLVEEAYLHELEEMLAHNTIDIMLCNVMERRQEFHYLPIAIDHFLLTAPVTHPCVKSGVMVKSSPFPWIDLRQLSGETFLLYHEKQALGRFCREELERQGVAPKQIRRFYSNDVVVQLVAEGFGVGFTRESYLHKEDSLENLRFFLFGDPPAFSELMVVARKSFPFPDCVLHLTELLRQNF